MDAFLEDFKHLKMQLEEIKLATSNFDNNHRIAKGGFGDVYLGDLSHSGGKSRAAFKRLANRGQGPREFWKEILMLSPLKHQNLISLIGYCDEGKEKIIVYEYASNQSLDRHLSSEYLTWKQRLKICLGAASGLCYLHDSKGTQERVVHRDVKSSNILLDDNWNAKVSDFGLSRRGPANLPITFMVTNVVGTLAYIDPVYVETGILTKESDIYSFGVVLFEVLCGRLCYEQNDNGFKSLVSMWRERNEQNKLDEIIFQDLKKSMDATSLEIFSEIAYKCLHSSRLQRPKMSLLVEQLELALVSQEIFEDWLPEATNYEEMCKTAIPPLVYTSKQELKMLLSKGILFNGGKTWFSVNKNAQHCEIISAADCLTPINYFSMLFRKKSRFPMGSFRPFCWEFKTHVRTQFLSPDITYTVNLVFSFGNTMKDYFSLNYISAGEAKSSTLYFANEREDGYFMAELYQFTSDTRNVDLAMNFVCSEAISVESIEFQPVERVEREELLEEEEVDTETVSLSDPTYWERKLPSDWKDILKWSNDELQSTATKEFYSIFCKGFPINNGEEWFSLAKNGKKSHMVQSRVALRKQEWSWRSMSESRFGEVAFDPHQTFQINCCSTILSLQTTYAAYLVYKLQENHYGYEPRVKVTDRGSLFGSYDKKYQPWYIHLLLPQTPIIRPKDSQNTHNRLNITNMKSLPRLRKDSWMEVQVWEFSTGTTSIRISKDLQLSFSSKKPRNGLIVQGIEFKHI